MDRVLKFEMKEIFQFYESGTFNQNPFVVCLIIVWFVVFHLLFISKPINSLFVFLLFIILTSMWFLIMNSPYLCFVLISIYGGAIVVLFLLVFMLLNKK